MKIKNDQDWWELNGMYYPGLRKINSDFMTRKKNIKKGGINF
jgi:hypothetical protein